MNKIIKYSALVWTLLSMNSGFGFWNTDPNNCSGCPNINSGHLQEIQAIYNEGADKNKELRVNADLKNIEKVFNFNYDFEDIDRSSVACTKGRSYGMGVFPEKHCYYDIYRKATYLGASTHKVGYFNLSTKS